MTTAMDVDPDYGGYPSLTEGVYAAIRRDILTLQLAPGSKLRLGELKERHTTGIAPIREALARLAGEGLVDTKSQRGFWVADISSDELHQLGELRATLEVMAFRFAVSQDRLRLSQELRRAWEAFSGLAQRAGETAPLNQNWEARHRAFHLAFFSFYRSPATSRLFENVYDRFDRYRRLGVPKKGFLAGVIDDHTLLLELIPNREDEEAADLIRRHISDVVAVVQANVSWKQTGPSS